MGERSHGWGPKGQPVRSKVTTQKAENLSLLPAFTINGYMTCSIFRGAVNAEIFEEFIEFNVLPHCNPFPGPKSIIVMDNAGIHIEEV
jgi:DDE superfamily endonuclease